MSYQEVMLLRNMEFLKNFYNENKLNHIACIK